MSATDEVAARIVAMEEAALERWCAGDPSGFLDSATTTSSISTHSSTGGSMASPR